MQLPFLVNIGDSFSESPFGGGECRMFDEGPSLGAKPYRETDEQKKGEDDHDQYDQRNSGSSQRPIP